MIAGERVGRRKLSIEKPTVGTEIIDELEGEVNGYDDCVHYIVSWPIHEGKLVGGLLSPPLRTKDGRATQITVAHIAIAGLGPGCWSGPQRTLGRMGWCCEVIRNLHARDRFKKRTIEILDLHEKAKSGDGVTVWLSPGSRVGGRDGGESYDTIHCQVDCDSSPLHCYTVTVTTSTFHGVHHPVVVKSCDNLRRVVCLRYSPRTRSTLCDRASG